MVMDVQANTRTSKTFWIYDTKLALGLLPHNIFLQQVMGNHPVMVLGVL